MPRAFYIYQCVFYYKSKNEIIRFLPSPSDEGRLFLERNDPDGKSYKIWLKGPKGDRGERNMPNWLDNVLKKHDITPSETLMKKAVKELDEFLEIVYELEVENEVVVK